MTQTPSTDGRSVSGAAAAPAPGHLPQPVQTADTCASHPPKGKTRGFFPEEMELSGESQGFQSGAGTQNQPHPSWNVDPQHDPPAGPRPHHHSVVKEGALPKGRSEATSGPMLARTQEECHSGEHEEKGESTGKLTRKRGSFCNRRAPS